MLIISMYNNKKINYLLLLKKWKRIQKRFST